jgi:hypothetical protein
VLIVVQYFAVMATAVVHLEKVDQGDTARLALKAM